MVEHPASSERLSDRLAQSQAPTVSVNAATRYRLYTEDTGDVHSLISRYFSGATLYRGVGFWQGATELSLTIEILGTQADLQSIVNLAGDIKVQNNQSSVLVTWEHGISRLDV